MAMRLTGIGSRYLLAKTDVDKNYFDGAKTYKVTLPEDIPEANFWRSRSTTTRRARCSTRRSAIRGQAARTFRHPRRKRTLMAPRPSISPRPSQRASNEATGFGLIRQRAGL